MFFPHLKGHYPHDPPVEPGGRQLRPDPGSTRQLLAAAAAAAERRGQWSYGQCVDGALPGATGAARDGPMIPTWGCMNQCEQSHLGTC